MHIKLLYRKVLYVFLSLMIVISSTQSAYAATGTWYPQSVVVNGKTALITAAKNGFRSSISHIPSVGSVARSLAKGSVPLALLLAVTQKLGDGVDWVLDPANNAVKYTTPYVDKGPNTVCLHKQSNSNMTAGAFCSSVSKSYQTITPAGQVQCGASVYSALSCPIPAPVNNYIPLEELAQKVIANAASGHTPSQEIIKDAATDDVFSGAVEAKLTNSQVESDAPFDPTRPNDPAATPFDASSLIAAMQSVMSAINNMSSSLKAKLESIGLSLGSKLDTIVDGQTETNRVINDSIDRAIENDNVKTADIVAAIEAIEGNTLDGQVINDAVDRAIAEGKTNTADIVAAIEAIEGNTLDGQVINDAVDRAISNDNANAKATQDVVSQSIDDAIEQSHVDAGTVSDAVTDGATATTEAIKEQTDAISQADPVTGETSLKLPSFCGWAGTVCDYMDWVKGEYQTVSDFVKAEPETMPDEPIVVADDPGGLGDVFRDKAEAGYVSFASQCPDNVLIPVSLMGASQTLNISYAGFCHFASLIRPAVILGAWISGLLIISGGRARE